MKVIYRHAEELTKLGHKVTIISPKRQGNNFYHLLKADTIRIRDFLHKVEDKPYYDTPPGVEHHIISLPLEKWMNSTKLTATIDILREPEFLDKNIVNPNMLTEILNTRPYTQDITENIIWPLLSFELWHRSIIKE